MFNFRKKIWAIAFAAALTFNAVPAFAQNKDITVKLNDETLEFDVPAMIINDRTMVPMRKIFEVLGFQVDWNASEKSISAHGPAYVYMKIGSNEMHVDDFKIEIDTPPQIVDRRTLIPLRALAEGLGCDVGWDKDTKTVSISTFRWAGNHNDPSTVDYTIYKGILEDVKNAYTYSEYLWYYLYDMDGDGIKELMVQTGEFEMEYQWAIYTIRNRNNAVLLGTVDAGHTILHPCEEGVSGIYKQYAHMGSEALYRITVIGSKIDEELLWDIPEPHSEMWSTPGNYSEYATFDQGGMLSAPVTDFSILK